MAEIKVVLRERNPWWAGEFKLVFKEREIYHEVQRFLSLPHIVSLTGLRRVGKTTLLLKIVEDAIKSGFDPRAIIYFTFDEFREVEIRKLIIAYEEILEKDFGKGNFLLLLDEVQKVPHWEDQLKGLYDLYQNRVKIIISGSESLFIKKKSRETLAGRIFEFKVEPLSFKEFVAFKNKEVKPIGLHEAELLRLFNEYILTMGFPELIGIKDKVIIQKYIKESIVEKIIYRDIPSIFKVKDPSFLEALVNSFMEEPGQLVEIFALAKEFKVSRQTMSNYLNYLENSFLLKKLYNFSRNRRKVERKLKKYYPTILSPELLFRDDVLSQSKKFEWLLAIQLKAEFFWRDPQKNEVDVVLTKEQKIYPVEIKYGKIETGGVLAFLKKFKLQEGYIISYQKEEKVEMDGKTISILPAYKFLLKD